MEASETLRSLAEVAVALTGFTGIVGVLGRRAGGEWSPLELLRLRMLLETSLAVLFLALVPLVLQHLGPARPVLWRVSNGFQAFVHVGGVYLLRHRTATLDPSQWPSEERTLTLLLLPVSAALIAAQVGQAADLLAGGVFLYLLGLVYLLGLAALHFVLLLLPDEG